MITPWNTAYWRYMQEQTYNQALLFLPVREGLKRSLSMNLPPVPSRTGREKRAWSQFMQKSKRKEDKKGKLVQGPGRILRGLLTALTGHTDGVELHVEGCPRDWSGRKVCQSSHEGPAKVRDQTGTRKSWLACRKHLPARLPHHDSNCDQVHTHFILHCMCVCVCEGKSEKRRTSLRHTKKWFPRTKTVTSQSCVFFNSSLDFYSKDSEEVRENPHKAADQSNTRGEAIDIHTSAIWVRTGVCVCVCVCVWGGGGGGCLTMSPL